MKCSTIDVCESAKFDIKLTGIEALEMIIYYKIIICSNGLQKIITSSINSTIKNNVCTFSFKNYIKNSPNNYIILSYTNSDQKFCYKLDQADYLFTDDKCEKTISVNVNNFIECP